MKIDDTNQEMIDKVSLYGYKRLDEPEFYCTEVMYSVLTSTKQVVSIRMTGDLASQGSSLVTPIACSAGKVYTIYKTVRRLTHDSNDTRYAVQDA